MSTKTLKGYIEGILVSPIKRSPILFRVITKGSS
jgi:hypothetical protein